ncbi:MAG: hypothetical protein ABIO17_00810 [Pseudoxanthomonas sp.]
MDARAKGHLSWMGAPALPGAGRADIALICRHNPVARTGLSTIRNTTLALALLFAVRLTFFIPPAQARKPCGTYATDTGITQQQMDAAVAGKTTRKQIGLAFGAPSRHAKLGDTQVW